ncbi:MAG: DUF58 domain-containing protein [Bdellovibrionales bacterium]
MKMKLEKLFRHERIYCFPNKYGFLGFAVFLIMIAAGATYQNNLIYMMAFLYLGLGLIAILQTARNIRNIEVAHVRIKPGFPGAMTDVEIIITNPQSDLKINLEVSLRLEGETIRISTSDIPARSFKSLKGTIRLPSSRGVYSIKRIGMHTTYPYLLFNVWKYSKSKMHEALVYPTPIGREFDQNFLLKHGEDFSGHKIYVAGDPFARIDWKVFARRDAYYVRQFNDGGEKELNLNWEQTQNLSFEERLSQYSLWILRAEEKMIQYDLSIPYFISGSGLGENHFEKCMEALTRANHAL